jgi:glutaredoxin
MIVTLYTKADCGLCEKAEDSLRAMQQSIQFELRLVYIEEEPALLERLGDRVPVVYVEGREVASAPVEEAAIRTALSS